MKHMSHPGRVRGGYPRCKYERWHGNTPLSFPCGPTATHQLSGLPGEVTSTHGLFA